jgi:hypothetical protein
MRPSSSERVGTLTSLTDMVRGEMDRMRGLAPAQLTAERKLNDEDVAMVDVGAERYLAAIPKRHRMSTLRDYRPATESQSQARQEVAQWIRHVGDEIPSMVALIGSTGTGKSHLLYAAARALLAAGHRPYVRAWYELADVLRYGGRSAYSRTMLEPQEARAQLHEATIVLLDEVRPTAGTQFDDMELTKAACAWYDRAVPVLITTNVSPLADVLGPAGASRFLQLVVTGPDYRDPSVALANTA